MYFCTKLKHVTMFRIKEILEMKGITAKELATRMDVTPQYISGIIRETGSASISVLARIAKELEVPVSSLFDDYLREPSENKCPHCGMPLNIKIEKGE